MKKPRIVKVHDRFFIYRVSSATTDEPLILYLNKEYKWVDEFENAHLFPSFGLAEIDAERLHKNQTQTSKDGPFINIGKVIVTIDPLYLIKTMK